MAEEAKELRGTLHVFEEGDNFLQLEIGKTRAKAWADSCATSFEDIKKLGGKNVVGQYAEKPNKQHPNAPFKNVLKVIESEEPVQNASGDDTMSKADWAKKDRIEQRGWIAKAIIEAFGVNAVTSYDTLAKYADFWFAWVYELKSPETRQESKPVAPGNASKSVVGKPSEGDPEKRRQTVIGAIQKLLPDAMKRQVELDSFAKSQNWPNKIAIAQDSLNALNISQLGEFYNHLKEAK